MSALTGADPSAGARTSPSSLRSSPCLSPRPSRSPSTSTSSASASSSSSPASPELEAGSGESAAQPGELGHAQSEQKDKIQIEMRETRQQAAKSRPLRAASMLRPQTGSGQLEASSSLLSSGGGGARQASDAAARSALSGDGPNSQRTNIKSINNNSSNSNNNNNNNNNSSNNNSNNNSNQQQQQTDNQPQQMHVCRLCDKLLSSSSSLDRHMLTHSGERPFVCKRCHMTFTTNGNMHRHMRTHLHKDSLARQQQELEQIKSLARVASASGNSAIAGNNRANANSANSNTIGNIQANSGSNCNQNSANNMAAAAAALNQLNHLTQLQTDQATATDEHLSSAVGFANLNEQLVRNFQCESQIPDEAQHQVAALINQHLVAALGGAGSLVNNCNSNKMVSGANLRRQQQRQQQQQQQQQNRQSSADYSLINPHHQRLSSTGSGEISPVSSSNNNFSPLLAPSANPLNSNISPTIVSSNQNQSSQHCNITNSTSAKLYRHQMAASSSINQPASNNNNNSNSSSSGNSNNNNNSASDQLVDPKALVLSALQGDQLGLESIKAVMLAAATAAAAAAVSQQQQLPVLEEPERELDSLPTASKRRKQVNPRPSVCWPPSTSSGPLDTLECEGDDFEFANDCDNSMDSSSTLNRQPTKDNINYEDENQVDENSDDEDLATEIDAGDAPMTIDGPSNEDDIDDEDPIDHEAKSIHRLELENEEDLNNNDDLNNKKFLNRREQENKQQRKRTKLARCEGAEQTGSLRSESNNTFALDHVADTNNNNNDSINNNISNNISNMDFNNRLDRDDEDEDDDNDDCDSLTSSSSDINNHNDAQVTSHHQVVIDGRGKNFNATCNSDNKSLLGYPCNLSLGNSNSSFQIEQDQQVAETNFDYQRSKLEQHHQLDFNNELHQSQQQQQQQQQTTSLPTPLTTVNGEIIEDISQSYVKTANPNAARKGGKRNRHCYKCKLCTYSSVDRCTLVRHLRIHSGERPYICGICRYAFTTKANCERHVRKRHKKQYNSLGGAGGSGVKGSNGGGRSLIITDHSNHQTIPVKVNPVAAQTISQTLQRIQEKTEQQEQQQFQQNNNNCNSMDEADDIVNCGLNDDEDNDSQIMMNRDVNLKQSKDHMARTRTRASSASSAIPMSTTSPNVATNVSPASMIVTTTAKPTTTTMTSFAEPTTRLVGSLKNGPMGCGKRKQRRDPDQNIGDDVFESNLPYQRRRLAIGGAQKPNDNLFNAAAVAAAAARFGTNTKGPSSLIEPLNVFQRLDVSKMFFNQQQQQQHQPNVQSVVDPLNSDSQIQANLPQLQTQASTTNELLANLMAQLQQASTGNRDDAATSLLGPISQLAAPGANPLLALASRETSLLSPKDSTSTFLFRRNPFNPLDLAAQALDLSCKFQSSK